MREKVCAAGIVLACAGFGFAPYLPETGPIETNSRQGNSSSSRSAAPDEKPDFKHGDPDDPYVDPAGDIFWNGLPTYFTGSEITNWRIANDFVVDNTVTVASVEFNAFDTSNTNFSAWDGTIYWEIRNNTNDKPGVVVASGEGINISRTFDLTFGDWDFYHWSMDFGTEVQLPGGTYWFVLKMNARCNERANFYWTEATGRASLSQHYDHECLNRWVANDVTPEHAFTLQGPGGGGELFSNGQPDYKGGVDVTGASQADDFIISEQATISGARFSLLDFDADDLLEWDGTGRWEIFSDANGLPGSSMASGDMVLPEPIVDRLTNVGEFRDFTFQFDQLVCVDPGTYWLSLRLNGLCFRTDLEWATSRIAEGNHATAPDCGSQWNSAIGELAFDILGAEECDVLYDGGRPNHRGGVEVTGDKVAGRFTLQRRATLESIEFSLRDLGLDDLDEWDRTGQWEVWSDADNAPEALLASGPMVDLNYAFDRLKIDRFFYDIRFRLGEDVCLDPGIYWLSLRLNQDCQVRFLYWSRSSSQNGLVYVDENCSGNWDSRTLSLSFLIRGTDGCKCLTLDVDPLVAGQSAEWRVSEATPNAEVAIVYGHQPGQTSVNGFADYCATFGIKGVNANRIVCRKKADGAGNLSCRKAIPSGLQGLRVLSQAAERGTCPNDECMSLVNDQVIQ